MRFPKKILIAVAALGIATSGALVTTFALNDAKLIKLKEDELREYEAKFYSEGSLLYETGKLKKGSVIGYGRDEKPVKRRTADGRVYQFVGWDITGEGLPDILPNRIYSNFSANAVFWRLPTIEKLLMDPELLAKLAELLQKLDVQLTPEQIQNILNWLNGLGIDWESIDLSIIEQLLDMLQLDLTQFMDMTGLDLEGIMAVLARPMFRYNASNSGAYYFRTQSYGNNYSNNTWTKADYYPKSNISAGSVNPLAYSTDKLAQYLNPSHIDMKYFNQGEYYPVPVNEINNTQNLDSDSYSLVNPTPAEPDEGYKFGATYSTDAMTFVPACSNVAIIASTMYFSNPQITEDENVYRQYARDHYLQVDEKYRSLFSRIAEERGITKDEGYNFLTQILQYFSDGFEFDYEVQAYPKNEDKILYFMNTAKRGIGTHFADAATMFFRTLGVPARCVNGYVDYCETGYEDREVSAIQNHYWTEIYLDGIGWLSFDASLAAGVLPEEYSQYLFNSVLIPDPESKNDVITSIDIELPQENYYQGDEFDVNDVKFHVTYEDGRQDILSADDLTYVSSINTNITGEQTLTAIAVSGTTVTTAEATVNVLPVIPESLEINEDSVQLKYFVGTQYNDNFINGVVTYNNGKNDYVFSSSMTHTPVNPNVEGEQTVTYSLIGYPDVNDTITVKFITDPDTPLDYIRVTNSPIDVSPGTTEEAVIKKLLILATYEDHLTRLVDSTNGEITLSGDIDFTTSGIHYVTVTYTEDGVSKSTEIQVNVKDRSSLSIYTSYETPDSSKVYDGYELAFGLNDLYLPIVYDAETLRLEITNIIYPPNYNGKTAGEYDIIYCFKVYDEQNKDVTKEFMNKDLQVTLDEMLLTKGTNFDYDASQGIFYLRRTYNIMDRQIIVSSNDLYSIHDQAAYNAAYKELSIDGLSSLGLADGDYIDTSALVWTGKVNPGGQSDNTVSLTSIIIRDRDGNDVTSSYDIDFIPGTINSGV